MGRESGVCELLGIIFIFSLLVQGSYAVENETNTSLNEGMNSTLNATINGTINGIISDGTNNSTINGTINGTISGIIDKTTSNAKIFKLILLLPIFYGNLLFLSWISRFFDKMNFCFVTFILAALLIWLLSLFFGVEKTLFFFVLPVTIVVIFLIIGAILYEIYSKWEKENKIKEVDEIIVIVSLHDMLRNFIIIFLGLMWPLILLYFFLEGIEYLTFYGERLQFPVYIIAASSIGILSYLYLSVEETFCQLIPEYKKLSIAWSYLRRITIAPFIALIGFYFLIHLQNIKEMSDINDYFVFIFSFFAGIFTKTIEEWIYAWVQRLLPGDKKNEFDARNEYNVKESEFIKKLRFDEDLAYALHNAKIRTIEELAAASDYKKLTAKLNFDFRNLGEKVGYLPDGEYSKRVDSYSDQQVKMYVDRAQTYMNMDKSEFVTKLKIDKDQAFKLYYFANIKTLEDLKNCDPHEVHDKICDCKEETEKLAKCEKIDFKKVYDVLCWCSEENIKKLKERAHKELEKKNNMDSCPKSKNKAESNTASTNNENHSNEENEGQKEG